MKIFFSKCWRVYLNSCLDGHSTGAKPGGIINAEVAKLGDVSGVGGRVPLWRSTRTHLTFKGFIFSLKCFSATRQSARVMLWDGRLRCPFGGDRNGLDFWRTCHAHDFHHRIVIFILSRSGCKECSSKIGFLREGGLSSTTDSTNPDRIIAIRISCARLHNHCCKLNIIFMAATNSCSRSYDLFPLHQMHLHILLCF